MKEKPVHFFFFKDSFYKFQIPMLISPSESQSCNNNNTFSWKKSSLLMLTMYGLFFFLPGRMYLGCIYFSICIVVAIINIHNIILYL